MYCTLDGHMPIKFPKTYNLALITSCLGDMKLKKKKNKDLGTTRICYSVKEYQDQSTCKCLGGGPHTKNKKIFFSNSVKCVSITEHQIIDEGFPVMRIQMHHLKDKRTRWSLLSSPQLFILPQ